MGESTFDVDAWLEEARPPQRAVTVFGRGDLVSRLQELRAQEKADAIPGHQPLAGSRYAAQIAEVTAQIEASAMVLHVRGLLNDERNELVEAHTTTSTGEDGKAVETFDARGYEATAYALSTVEPALTKEQMVALRPRIGEAQWQAIGSAINAATEEAIDVPLSRLGSVNTPPS